MKTCEIRTTDNFLSFKREFAGGLKGSLSRIPFVFIWVSVGELFLPFVVCFLIISDKGTDGLLWDAFGFKNINGGLTLPVPTLWG